MHESLCLINSTDLKFHCERVINSLYDKSCVLLICETCCRYCTQDCSNLSRFCSVVVTLSFVTVEILAFVTVGTENVRN